MSVVNVYKTIRPSSQTKRVACFHRPPPLQPRSENQYLYTLHGPISRGDKIHARTPARGVSELFSHRPGLLNGPIVIPRGRADTGSGISAGAAYLFISEARCALCSAAFVDRLSKMNIEPVCSSLHCPRTAPILGSGAAPALFSSHFDEPVFHRVAALVITNVCDWSHVFIRYGPPSFPPSKIIPSKGCAARRDTARNLDSGTRSLDYEDGRALSQQQMRPRKG